MKFFEKFPFVHLIWSMNEILHQMASTMRCVFEAEQRNETSGSLSSQDLLVTYINPSLQTQKDSRSCNEQAIDADWEMFQENSLI